MLNAMASNKVVICNFSPSFNLENQFIFTISTCLSLKTKKYKKLHRYQFLRATTAWVCSCSCEVCMAQQTYGAISMQYQYPLQKWEICSIRGGVVAG